MLVIPYGDPQAHGTIGKTITFVRRRGIIYAKPYKIPYDPNSAGQQAQRSDFSDAVESWRLTTPETKNYYNLRASGMPYTGYNLYISKYLLGELPSTTALPITNMLNAVIGVTRADVSNGWTHTFAGGNPYIPVGKVKDNQNTFTSMATSPSADRSRVKVQIDTENINIIIRDTVTIDFDTVTNFLVYYPNITTNTTLYLADDGSTYFNEAMTKLACASGF